MPPLMVCLLRDPYRDDFLEVSFPRVKCPLSRHTGTAIWFWVLGISYLLGHVHNGRLSSTQTRPEARCGLAGSMESCSNSPQAAAEDFARQRRASERDPPLAASRPDRKRRAFTSKIQEYEFIYLGNEPQSRLS